MKYRGIIYCVHLGGIGHLKRMITLSQELLKFSELIFIQAGCSSGVTLKHPHFKHLLLPFGDYLLTPSYDLEKLSPIFSKRKRILFREIDFTLNFDFIISEQIPFTKVLWLNEFLSIANGLKVKNSNLKVFCSHKGSTRNINSFLNQQDKSQYLMSDKITAALVKDHYDKVFVHSDPRLLHLDENFFEYETIKNKILYTGFISSHEKKYEPQKRNEKEILVSLGAGPKLDYYLPNLLNSIIDLKDYKFTIVTGLLASKKNYAFLKSLEKKFDHIEIIEFIEKIDQKLLTCSMAIVSAGFTLINTYITSTPTLVIPDEREGSQNYLCMKFKKYDFINVIRVNQLNKDFLKEMIEKTIQTPPKPKIELDIQGASKCSRFIFNSLKKNPS